MVARGQEKRPQTRRKVAKKKASPLVSSKLSCIRSAADGRLPVQVRKKVRNLMEVHMHCTSGKMSLATGDAIEGIIRVRVGFALREKVQRFLG